MSFLRPSNWFLLRVLCPLPSRIRIPVISATARRSRALPANSSAQFGLQFREMPNSDICCGSAGIYNIVENEMAMAILETKMESVNQTNAEIVATANPGCLLQLEAGVRLHGHGQRVC